MSWPNFNLTPWPLLQKGGGQDKTAKKRRTIPAASNGVNKFNCKMKFTSLLICFMALLPLSSRAQITIEQVKSNIGFDGNIGKTLRGLCDAWYGKALQDGMMQEQAAKLALDSLGSTLLRMADWGMPDSPEMISIDGGGRTYTRLSIETKKDTVAVDVLCLLPKSSDVAFLTRFPNVVITVRDQERTLECLGRYEPATSSLVGNRQYVVKSTRWLQPMEGCYHLVKITDGGSSSN
jgi:hypothetical protein